MPRFLYTCKRNIRVLPVTDKVIFKKLCFTVKYGVEQKNGDVQ